jgi:hypothetical protein
VRSTSRGGPTLFERVHANHYTGTLESDEGNVYYVHCHHGAWTCNCPDSKYRKPDGGCKHIFALRRRLEERLREQAEVALTEPKPSHQEQPIMQATETPAREPVNEARGLNHVEERRALSRAVEEALVQGNLANLNPEQRVEHYLRVCESLGLNPHTSPFDYITFQGKMRLYAKRDCTDQLRRLRGVSVASVQRSIEEGVLTVEVHVTDGQGRHDVELGCVSVTGLKGEALANAHMKALTKAKRRATLSVCGLGWLDETELASVPVSVEPQPIANLPAQTPSAPDVAPISDAQSGRIGDLCQALGITARQLEGQVKKDFSHATPGRLTHDEAQQLIARLEKLQADRARDAQPETVNA